MGSPTRSWSLTLVSQSRISWRNPRQDSLGSRSFSVAELVEAPAELAGGERSCGDGIVDDAFDEFLFNV